MAIEKDITMIDKVKHQLKPLELYLLLDQKEQLKETSYYKELLNNYDVIIFINKRNIMKKEDECPICKEIVDCIPLECTHYICINCYPTIVYSKKCPLCRLSILSSINK